MSIKLDELLNRHNVASLDAIPDRAGAPQVKAKPNNNDLASRLDTIISQLNAIINLLKGDNN